MPAPAEMSARLALPGQVAGQSGCSAALELAAGLRSSSVGRQKSVRGHPGDTMPEPVPEYRCRSTGAGVSASTVPEFRRRSHGAGVGASSTRRAAPASCRSFGAGVPVPESRGQAVRSRVTSRPRIEASRQDLDRVADRPRPALPRGGGNASCSDASRDSPSPSSPGCVASMKPALRSPSCARGVRLDQVVDAGAAAADVLTRRAAAARGRESTAADRAAAAGRPARARGGRRRDTRRAARSDAAAPAAVELRRRSR